LLAAFASVRTGAVFVGISDRGFGGQWGKIQAEAPPSEVVHRAVLQQGG
jgi:hypothetical protein